MSVCACVSVHVCGREMAYAVLYRQSSYSWGVAFLEKATMMQVEFDFSH